MRHARLTLMLVAATSLTTPTVAGAEPWHRAYVVDWFEHAFYFGGGKDGADKPGTDCAKGSNPEINYRKIMVTSYRTDEETRVLMDPNNRDKIRFLGIRGPNREDVYREPESVPDPGILPMTGTIAEGLDLDDDPRTGFTAPDGRRGIDNAFYKELGCWYRYRAQAREAFSSKYENDGMRDGGYTMLVIVSGEESPENDRNATVGFYVSKDKMVKDAKGAIAADYSFRIDPDPGSSSVHKVTITDGLIESAGSQRLRLHAPNRTGGGRRSAVATDELDLERGKLRLRMKPDGTLSGVLGGYRDTYTNYMTASNAIIELVTRIEAPAVWYALKRGADYGKDPKTGRNTKISMAFTLDALPAFVVAPGGQLAQAALPYLNEQVAAK